jgi:hypothetical protein
VSGAEQGKAMKALIIPRTNLWPIVAWGSVLVALMLVDVLVSAGVILGNHANLLEGNPLARSLGVWWIAAVKIVFAIALSLYSIWRNSVKALRLASFIMLGLAAWNIAMLLVFRY